MADNSTTYTATIDVETKGITDIEVLNKTVDTSIGTFETLNQAIGGTEDALGKLDPKKDAAKIKVLNDEMKQLRLRQEDVAIGSRRFSEALAEQPGIIGLVGGSLDGLRGTMKVFMANPIIAVVTAIAGAFIMMKESLSKTSEGQETLNRIGAAFGKIMGPVFALIEKIALPIFEKFADLLELVGNGFNRFAKFLGISSEKIEEASRNSSEVLNKAYEEEQTRQEELTKKTEEESNKRIANEQREADERKRIRDMAAAIQLEAELSLLDERTRALREREMRYHEERKVLLAAGYEDLSALEQEYYMDAIQIKRKFDGDMLVSTIKAKGIQGMKGLEVQKDIDMKAITFQKKTSEVSQDINAEEQEAKLQVISGALNAVAQMVGENTVAGKALAVASASINTYLGATKALATYPPPFGAIAAGVVIAGGLLQVKKIISTKVPKPPGTNLRGGGGGGAPSPAPPPTISLPEIESTAAAGGNTGSQISETIAQSSNRPVQAYVVSTEVSSVQSLDRRTNNAATFGGGTAG